MNQKLLLIAFSILLSLTLGTTQLLTTSYTEQFVTISKNPAVSLINVEESSSTLIVTSNEDTNTPGTLRWAINQANSDPNEDIIDLSAVKEPIVLEETLPKIYTNMIIEGNGRNVISGNHLHRVFYLQQGNVVLKNFNIVQGLAKGDDGIDGSGGGAGMGGGLFMAGGNLKLAMITFIDNQAIGGEGAPKPSEESYPTNIEQNEGRFYVNRGAVSGINGISLKGLDVEPTELEEIQIKSEKGEFFANRGAIAGVNGIGIEGIGSIVFGGGGGFGGFGNAGNGGNGGNGGYNGGNGGNGGDGGDGGIGFFGSFGNSDESGAIGAISFGGGGGFGGFGNAGNGGNGGNICGGVQDNSSQSNSEVEENPEPEIPEPPLEIIICGDGGDGGNGGNGGFGGGGGGAGNGGKAGIPGKGGFAGGDADVGFGGGGAGLGGAIFVKSGNLILDNTNFIHNVALGGQGVNPGLGKGGAIFIMTAPFNPQVFSLELPPQFRANLAQDAASLPTDNQDIYGTIKIQARMQA